MKLNCKFIIKSIVIVSFLSITAVPVSAGPSIEDYLKKHGSKSMPPKKAWKPPPQASKPSLKNWDSKKITKQHKKFTAKKPYKYVPPPKKPVSINKQLEKWRTPYTKPQQNLNTKNRVNIDKLREMAEKQKRQNAKRYEEMKKKAQAAQMKRQQEKLKKAQAAQVKKQQESIKRAQAAQAKKQREKANKAQSAKVKKQAAAQAKKTAASSKPKQPAKKSDKSLSNKLSQNRKVKEIGNSFEVVKKTTVSVKPGPEKKIAQNKDIVDYINQVHKKGMDLSAQVSQWMRKKDPAQSLKSAKDTLIQAGKATSEYYQAEKGIDLAKQYAVKNPEFTKLTTDIIRYQSLPKLEPYKEGFADKFARYGGFGIKAIDISLGKMKEAAERSGAGLPAHAVVAGYEVLKGGGSSMSQSFIDYDKFVKAGKIDPKKVSKAMFSIKKLYYGAVDGGQNYLAGEIGGRIAGKFTSEGAGVVENLTTELVASEMATKGAKTGIQHFAGKPGDKLPKEDHGTSAFGQALMASAKKPVRPKVATKEKASDQLALSILNEASKKWDVDVKKKPKVDKAAEAVKSKAIKPAVKAKTSAQKKQDARKARVSAQINRDLAKLSGRIKIIKTKSPAQKKKTPKVTTSVAQSKKTKTAQAVKKSKSKKFPILEKLPAAKLTRGYVPRTQASTGARLRRKVNKIQQSTGSVMLKNRIGQQRHMSGQTLKALNTAMRQKTVFGGGAGPDKLPDGATTSKRSGEDNLHAGSPGK
ncbi:hypothetical protein ACFLQ8_00840 [Candidatus Auribacterota bacterium]